jgi:5-methylcytosine-specific restriction endonuclease McrA
VIEKSEVNPYPFTYPSRHIRRHGPTGYKNYESYRDWLRDEFSFRCVFCLCREQWGLVGNAWNIDHFTPQSRVPQGILQYDNLLYVCSTCNSLKSAHLVPDPATVPFVESLSIAADGTIHALNDNGRLLIQVLRLDNEDHTRFRSLILKTLRVLAVRDWETFVLWMGYPTDLPDLSKLRPPEGNTRPDGVDASFFARRRRGELEATFE